MTTPQPEREEARVTDRAREEANESEGMRLFRSGLLCATHELAGELIDNALAERERAVVPDGCSIVTTESLNETATELQELRTKLAAFAASGLADEHGKPRKVLGTLPLTADGCIAGMGAMMYLPEGGERTMHDYAFEPGAIEDDPNCDVSICFSSREAALAAKEGQQ